MLCPSLNALSPCHNTVLLGAPHLTSSPPTAEARWRSSCCLSAATWGSTPAATSSAMPSSSPKSIMASRRAGGSGRGGDRRVGERKRRGRGQLGHLRGRVGAQAPPECWGWHSELAARQAEAAATEQLCSTCRQAAAPHKAALPCCGGQLTQASQQSVPPLLMLPPRRACSASKWTES